MMVTMDDGSYKPIPIADMNRHVRPLNPASLAQPFPEPQVVTLANKCHSGPKRLCVEASVFGEIANFGLIPRFPH